MRNLLFLLLTLTIASCKSKPEADALYYNGTVYTVDSSFSVVTAFAVKDGKIIATGTNDAILKIKADKKVDLKGRFVYPGFIDPHCHFYGYGVDHAKIWLGGTTSYRAIIDTLIVNKNQQFMGWIFARGWDQNDWEVKEYPDNTILDSLFPDIPVYMLRIDAHAALVNSAALKKAGITANTKIEGGEIVIRNGKLTGLLIDKAMELVSDMIPEPSDEHKVNAVLYAQKNCFSVGLTSIGDAGLNPQTILMMDSLQKNNELKMRCYVMVSWNKDNAFYFKKSGKIKTDYLNVRSFKLYADGALGSRGACLSHPYTDQPDHYGFMFYTVDSLRQAMRDAIEAGFQLNTHSIGDSANRVMLKLYAEALQGKNDLRWRIEHAQVVDSADRHFFRDYSIIPSVQPTHATSDMYWAESRLGKERMKGAYSYRSLLQTAGVIADGSDFPVEDINPLYGFYAAVSRKDRKGFPAEGFKPEESLNREEALRAMTSWAAFAAFEENEKGSIVRGYFADFVILEEDIMKVPVEKLHAIKVQETFTGGVRVY